MDLFFECCFVAGFDLGAERGVRTLNFILFLVDGETSIGVLKGFLKKVFSVWNSFYICCFLGI